MVSNTWKRKDGVLAEKRAKSSTVMVQLLQLCVSLHNGFEKDSLSNKMAELIGLFAEDFEPSTWASPPASSSELQL